MDVLQNSSNGEQIANVKSPMWNSTCFSKARPFLKEGVILPVGYMYLQMTHSDYYLGTAGKVSGTKYGLFIKTWKSFRNQASMVCSLIQYLENFQELSMVCSLIPVL